MEERVPFLARRHCVMASTESGSFAAPRGCRVMSAMKSESREDMYLVEINPVVIGQDFGLGGCDISEVVVATRLEGESLDLLSSQRPVPVYVLLMNSPYLGQSDVSDEDMTLIAWAEIYPSTAAFEEEQARMRAPQ